MDILLFSLDVLPVIGCISRWQHDERPECFAVAAAGGGASRQVKGGRDGLRND